MDSRNVHTWKWWVAGLVTVVVFAAVTLLFANVLVPALQRHADSGTRLGWGFGAGTAAAALAALWGTAYATDHSSPGSEPSHLAGGGQIVRDSIVEGGVTQVSGAGSVRVTRHRSGTSIPSLPAQSPPSEPGPILDTPSSKTPAEGTQSVEGAQVRGPVDQIREVDGDAEIEQ